MLVVGVAADRVVFDKLVSFDVMYQLGNQLVWQEIEKTNQKSLLAIATANHYFMALIKEVPHLLHYDEQRGELIKIALNWQALTKRVVSAGRKSELLLQACKLTAKDTVIDATAGFGYDALILASTGATVTMIEQNPIMALLLFAEKQAMYAYQHWHGLLSRLSIVHDSVLNYTQSADMVYLDPMFPKDSYGARVNKHMQALHGLVFAPSIDEEKHLLAHAKRLAPQGRVIVKRPIGAPFLANEPPVQSWQNEALRFDGYKV